MPKKLIKRYLPHPEKLKNHKQLRPIAKFLQDDNLWHLNRRSVPKAVAIGLFCAFIPLPLQMLIAALLAISIRVNVMIAVCLVWVSNPLTIPPLFYFAYKVGQYCLHLPAHDIPGNLSVEWFTSQIDYIWRPLVFGSILCGTVSGLIGMLSIQLAWRIWIIKQWRLRRSRN